MIERSFSPVENESVVVIICGVSGAGKTVIGKALAGKLNWSFYDADDFHSPLNIEKMRRGIGLTDDDRQPWLDVLRAKMEECIGAKENVVLACSALKRKYRERLRVNDAVSFVYLRGDRSLIAAQLEKRTGHFMNPLLLDSQFADLEEPQLDERVTIVDLGKTPNALTAEIQQRLHLQHSTD